MAPQSWSQRYTDSYGLPPGRPVEIPSTNLEDNFYRTKVIDGGHDKIGGLNLGIYLFKRKTDGKTFVQKKIDGKEKYLRREIHVLLHLKHPNIINFVTAFITPPPRQASLYMEFCDLGSLDRVIEKYSINRSSGLPISIPQAFIWHVFQSLISALQYIHHGIKSSDPSLIKSHKGKDLQLVEKLRKKWPTILHCDVKLGNILLCRSYPILRQVKHPRAFPFCFASATRTHDFQPFPRVVLADFGAACQQEDGDWEDKDDTFTGTLSWMPPELPIWSERGDVWSLGAVILSLCNLLPSGPLNLPPAGPPWDDDPESWYKSKQCRKNTIDIDIGQDYSGYLGDTIWHCLRAKAEDRPFSFRLMAFVNEGKRLAALEGKLSVRELPPWVISPRNFG